MNNPFQPPSSEVADVLPAVDLTARPRVVVIACVLLCASLISAGASFVVTLRDDFLSEESISFAFSMGVAVVAVLTYVVEVTFIYYAYRRANWARWVLLGLYALSWLIMLNDPADWSDDDAVVLVLDIATAALEVTACILLFTSTSRRWFAARLDA